MSQIQKIYPKCQRKFLHAIPPARVERGPRLSITFTVEPKAPIEDCDWVLYRNEDWEAAGVDQAKSPIVGQLPIPVFVGTVHDVFHRWKKDPTKYRAMTPWFQQVRSLGDLAYHRPEFEKGVIEEAARKRFGEEAGVAIEDTSGPVVPELAFEAVGLLLERLSDEATEDGEEETETSRWLRSLAGDLLRGEDHAKEIVESVLKKVL